MRSQPEGSKFHHFVGKHGTRQTGRVSCVGGCSDSGRLMSAVRSKCLPILSQEREMEGIIVWNII